jgi:glycine/D-amino acid oxidase-like deaminating enzyme
VDVRVLESGHIGWGSSGRNGGFCCLPATKLSIQSLIKRYGLDETKRFYAAQLEGIELVRALGKDEAIDFDLRGDGNFTVAHRPARFADLADEAEALTKLFGIRTR